MLSNKRKETELKRLQNPNLELTFGAKVKFQDFNPHPVFHVAKIENKTTPAPIEVVHIDFERDLNLSSLIYGKIVFYNPYSGLKYTTSFQTLCIPLYNYSSTLFIPNIFYNFCIYITNKNRQYLPSDDPNITNLMVSHYDCAKQQHLGHFNLLNVKQCTEAPSSKQHASVKARVYVRAKAKRNKA